MDFKFSKKLFPVFPAFSMQDIKLPLKLSVDRNIFFLVWHILDEYQGGFFWKELSATGCFVKQQRQIVKFWKERFFSLTAQNYKCRVSSMTFFNWLDFVHRHLFSLVLKRGVRKNPSVKAQSLRSQRFRKYFFENSCVLRWKVVYLKPCKWWSFTLKWSQLHHSGNWFDNHF